METVRSAVDSITQTVFPGIQISGKVRTRSYIKSGGEVKSSLPLQMALYFNVYFSPVWFLTHICTLNVKYAVLSQLYKIVLVTVMVVVVIVEIPRLYLGYIGNLTEKVPELAGFWLLTLLLQFPLHALLLFNENTIILPLERAVDILMMTFIVFEIIAGYFAIKVIAHQQMTRFHQQMQHLEEFSLVDNQ
ncbi:transmembrane protein 17-like [Limulus polyphemus]|uniref:Transmembrane protein 17-like n=1 Tax=Limulus polyphemus TaxID=6850 RepID=A0ABM1BNH1_LIMPO|nr:transmembrane protein 17-like [Limulus polyphemus]